ncbi:MAG TPA: peptidoglycan DD-metalloendopeptidase family protein [Nevskiaceae bacterium]|nr:peptidoglycan DD-metalloendopeptidase family protein [Nevskiaceae bacterium]
MHWSDEPPRRSHHESTNTLRDAGSGERTYTVKAGDTLYSIARKYGADYHDLAKWNGIGSDYRLEIGQVLKLGASGSSARASSKHRAKPIAAPSPEVAREEPSVAPREKPEPAAAAMERYYAWQWPLRGPIAKTYAPEGGSKGLDIAGDLGQTVIAAAPGRVVYSGSGLKGYGELVIIKHDETYLSAYGYNRKRLVNEGDMVTAGQPVAELGTGPEQKPLLHFEIREHGKPIDPLPLLPAK